MGIPPVSDIANNTALIRSGIGTAGAAAAVSFLHVAVGMIGTVGLTLAYVEYFEYRRGSLEWAVAAGLTIGLAFQTCSIAANFLHAVALGFVPRSDRARHLALHIVGLSLMYAPIWPIGVFILALRSTLKPRDTAVLMVAVLLLAGPTIPIWLGCVWGTIGSEAKHTYQFLAFVPPLAGLTLQGAIGTATWTLAGYATTRWVRTRRGLGFSRMTIQSSTQPRTWI